MSNFKAKAFNRSDKRSDFSEKIASVTGRPSPGTRFSWGDNKRYDSQQGNKGNPYFALPDKRQLGVDGKEHINCTFYGSTDLGKALSSQNSNNFKHSNAGSFRTLEGFMWYLRTEDDRFRNMPGYAANKTGRDIPAQAKKNVPSDYFILLVADAYWQQISKNENLAKAVSSSTLPFDMYLVDVSGMRIRITHADWLVHALTLIRDALQDGLSYPHLYKLFADNYRFGMKGLRQAYRNRGLTYEKDVQYTKAEISEVYGEFVQEKVKAHFEGLVDEDYVRQRQQHQQAHFVEPAGEPMSLHGESGALAETVPVTSSPNAPPITKLVKVGEESVTPSDPEVTGEEVSEPVMEEDISVTEQEGLQAEGTGFVIENIADSVEMMTTEMPDSPAQEGFDPQDILQMTQPGLIIPDASEVVNTPDVPTSTEETPTVSE